MRKLLWCGAGSAAVAALMLVWWTGDAVEASSPPDGAEVDVGLAVTGPGLPSSAARSAAQRAGVADTTALSIPVNTVRSRRRLARQAFQQLWRTTNGEDQP